MGARCIHSVDIMPWIFPALSRHSKGRPFHQGLTVRAIFRAFQLGFDETEPSCEFAICVP